MYSDDNYIFFYFLRCHFPPVSKIKYNSDFKLSVFILSAKINAKYYSCLLVTSSTNYCRFLVIPEFDCKFFFFYKYVWPYANTHTHIHTHTQTHTHTHTHIHTHTHTYTHTHIHTHIHTHTHTHTYTHTHTHTHTISFDKNHEINLLRCLLTFFLIHLTVNKLITNKTRKIFLNIQAS